jgi:hypothetical protein
MQRPRKVNYHDFTLKVTYYHVFLVRAQRNASVYRSFKCQERIFHVQFRHRIAPIKSERLIEREGASNISGCLNYRFREKET